VRVVHVLRKPLGETSVAANILRNGCGAINIDATRIDYLSDSDKASAIPQGTCTAKVGALAGGTQNERSRTEFQRPELRGRWPANVILEHRPGCRRVGLAKVRGTPKSYVRNADRGNVGVYGPGIGEPAGVLSRNYADEDGLETIDEWDCEPGCPVAALDGESGHLHARGNIGAGKGGGGMYGHGECLNYFGAGDAGGASRFFKRVGGSRR